MTESLEAECLCFSLSRSLCLSLSLFLSVGGEEGAEAAAEVEGLAVVAAVGEVALAVVAGVVDGGVGGRVGLSGDLDVDMFDGDGVEGLGRSTVGGGDGGEGDTERAGWSKLHQEVDGGEGDGILAFREVVAIASCKVELVLLQRTKFIWKLEN